jgi:asparagine synthase (glutamine-hydrolysing)
MCGIAGVVDWSAADHTGSVERQLDTLGHRGPDSRGIHTSPGAAVGQTRLAVIDLVTGDPPITDETGTVAVSLNGEIYNFLSLAEGLAAGGHTLATRCDTEVIAHLAEDLDPVDLARRLDGMFAFAVWDGRRRRLVLGRDRLGKKPLYYWSDGRRLVFGSEIKAVLAAPFVSPALEADAIPAYLTFGYVPTPRTFFAGIQSVPPGHVLTVEEGAPPRIERYWEPRVPGASDVSRLDLPVDACADEVLAHLTRAVERRLISDVPLGAFLSGGVDSSAVVAIMARLQSRPVRTFTIGFEDSDGFDERPYARTVAQRFGTEHIEFVVKPDAVDLVEGLVWHHDQPFGDSSAIPTYLLSELTKAHVTVALSGDGGDEVFAGYERFGAALALSRYQRLPPAVRRRLAAVGTAVPASALSGRGAGLHRFLAPSELPVVEAFLGWVGFVPEEWRARLVPGASPWAVDDYLATWKASEGGGLLDRLLHLNLQTYLLDDLLPKVDRMSMAHGLEVRSPFLDRELVEFALRLPASAQRRGMAGKVALKRALAGVLPRDILHRRKKGFGVPLDRWFRTDLRTYLETMLGAGARVRAHVRGDALDAMLGEHQSGAANHRDSLWAILTLEVFLRRHGW